MPASGKFTDSKVASRAGLPNEAIGAKIKAAATNFSSVEIPTLSLEDFTAVLCRKCGDSSTKWLELQVQGAREVRAFGKKLEQQRSDAEGTEQQFFGFLEEAHRRGMGSPLYATYLAEDLRSGAVKIGDAIALPDGLDGYHNLQLERTGVLRMLNPVPRPVQKVAIAEFEAALEMRHERALSAEGLIPTGVEALFNPVDEHLACASVLALLATDSNAATEDEITERLRFTVLRGQTSEECLMAVERALTAVGPLLKSAPIDESGKEGFALANPSVRRHLKTLAGVQLMERRFARRAEAPADANPDVGDRREEFPSSERHWLERAVEDRPNTPEIEKRVTDCVKGMEALGRCFEVSELFSNQTNNAQEGYLRELFDGTMDEAVAQLRRDGNLLLKPSMAFGALGRVGHSTDFNWSRLQSDAPNILRRAAWREPSLWGEDRGRYYHLRSFVRHLRSFDRDDWSVLRGFAYAHPLVSALDLTLNGWIRKQIAFLDDHVRVSGVSMPAEFQAVCSTVAGILEMVRYGADMAPLDACPVAVRVHSQTRGADSDGHVGGIYFRF